MDQLYHGQLHLFILTTTTLFTGIQSMGDSSHNWFHAQKQCSGHGLTIEENQSDQPYWTGVYRRLTPWINIIGCYSDSIESLQDVVKKTLAISSVGLCQEMCFHENGYQFALKMNICLCIGSDILFNPKNGLSPSNCTYRCEDYSGDRYLSDCGGESAYNIYEIQGVEFKSMEYNSLESDYKSMEMNLCLSLQCTESDTRFIPQKCSKALSKICGNRVIPENSYACSWNLSMEQCRKSQPSTYLSGDFDLEHPHPVCSNIHEPHVVWVGVVRQTYTNIDQGCEIEEEQRETFVECQMCAENKCRLRRCTDLLDSSIYCNSVLGTSQSQIIESVTTSHGSFSTANLALNQTTTKQLSVSTSTTANYDTDKLPPINDTVQMSGTSAELALEIALPITIVLIISLISVMTLVFYRRRKQITKTERTTKEEIDSVRKTTVHFKNNYIKDDSYFVLEQCSQKISKGSDSVNESPYNESEEGVYDHLRDIQVRRPEVEDTYQHASTGVSTDLSEYDTMANARDKKQEEESSYDYTHTDKNKNYRTDLRAHNHLTDSPYDVAV